MTTHPPGRIYLADQHGTLTTAHSRRSSVFSFGPYHDAQRPALGRLLAFNHETLPGGQSLALAMPARVCCVVLPLTGAVCCAAGGPATEVAVEQTWLAQLAPHEPLTLQNPFATETVELLHLWFAVDDVPPTAPVTLEYTFAALEQGLATLVESGPGRPFRLLLGRLQGRQEVEYQAQRPGQLVFGYALAGAFEAAGRLLHPHDGLALWPTQAVELEALSNNALLLVLEVAA